MDYHTNHRHKLTFTIENKNIFYFIITTTNIRISLCINSRIDIDF